MPVTHACGGGGEMLGGSSRSKPLIRRADVTKSLTALPGVVFVVGNKRRGADLAVRATL